MPWPRECWLPALATCLNFHLECRSPPLALADITFGFEDLEGFSPRPPGVVSANEGARLTSDSVVIRRTYD